MSTVDDGGPAFPDEFRRVHRVDGFKGGDFVAKGGMSLRDWFAGQALTSLEGRTPWTPEMAEVAEMNFYTEAYQAACIKAKARWSYEMADAMLAERAKRG